jgi:amidase
MRRLLAPDAILCFAMKPFPAPQRGEPLSTASAQRDRILCLCAHGGLTGVPQMSIPGAELDGLPVGLPIVGSPGSDATLVAVAAALTRM